MELKSYYAQDKDGVTIPGAYVYLYKKGTTAPVSGIQGANGDSLPNPFQADQDGLIQLAAPDGVYDLRVSSAGLDRTIPVSFLDTTEALNIIQTAASQTSQDADRAEAAKDAAQLTAGVFPDTASGLASTSPDEYFSVPSNQDDEILILYRHETGGTATEINRYPSSSAVKSLQETIPMKASTSFGKNLFDKESVVAGYLTSDTGSEVYDSDSFISDYIPVTQGESYYLSGRTLSGTKVIVFYDNNKNKIPPTGTDYEDVVLNGSLVAPSGASFVRFTVEFNGSGRKDTIQFESGTEKTDFEEFRKEIQAYHLQVTPDYCTFFEQQINFFDPENVVTGSLLNNSDGSIVASTTWSYATIDISGFNSPFISVNKGLSDVSDNDDVLHFFDNAGNRIGFSNSLQAVVPSGATTLKINVASTLENKELAVATFQVENRESNGKYVPFRKNKVIERRFFPDANESSIKGHVITWIGDSIIKGTGFKPWPSLIDSLHGSVSINKGDSGATIANIYPDASCVSGSLLTYNYNINTSLTIFSAGTNDFDRGLPIGSEQDMLDSNDSTVKGSLYKAIQWVKSNNPESKILVFTPIERSTDTNNSIGLRLKDYRDAIIDVCSSQSVDVCDNMYNNLISIPTAYKYLYDGLHPNQEGYDVSLDKISESIVNLLKGV